MQADILTGGFSVLVHRPARRLIEYVIMKKVHIFF